MNEEHFRISLTILGVILPFLYWFFGVFRQDIEERRHIYEEIQKLHGEFDYMTRFFRSLWCEFKLEFPDADTDFEKDQLSFTRVKSSISALNEKNKMVVFDRLRLWKDIYDLRVILADIGSNLKVDYDRIIRIKESCNGSERKELLIRFFVYSERLPESNLEQFKH